MPTQAELIAVLELLTRRANPPHRPAQRLDLPAAARLPDGLCGAWLRGLPLRSGLQTARCDLRATPLAAKEPAALSLQPPAQAAWPGSGYASRIALSPDGRLLAMAGDGLWLWALQEDAELLPLWGLEGGDAGFCSLAFSPDGRQIAVGDYRGLVRLVGLRDEGGLFLQARLDGHGDAVNALVYSADGHYLFSAGNDMTLRSWRLIGAGSAHDAATPQLLTARPHALCLESGGSRLYVALDNGQIEAWMRLADGSLVASGGISQGVATSLAFADGRLYCAMLDGDLGWLSADLAPGVRHPLVSAGSYPVLGLGERLLAIGGGSQGNELRLVPIDGAGLSGPVQTLGSSSEAFCGLVFSTDGRLLLAVDRSATLWRWALQTDGSAHPLPPLRRPVSWLNALAFHPSGQQLVCGGGDARLQRWRLGSLPQEESALALQSSISSLAWHPRGLWCASGDGAGVVQLHGGPTLSDLLGRYPTPGGQVQALAVSPDGAWLAAAQGLAAVRLWAIDAAGLLVEAPPLPSGGYLSALAFDPAGDWLACAGPDQSITLWPCSGGRLQGESRRLDGHEAGPLCLAFAPKGSWLLSADGNGGLSLWNLQAASGAERQALTRSARAPIWTLGFHPAGLLFALGDGNGDIELWRLDSQQPSGASFVQRWPAHPGGVSRLAFAPDGSWLASVGGDGALRLSAPGDDGQWQVQWQLIGAGLMLQEQADCWLLRRSDGKAFDSQLDAQGRRRLADAIAYPWLWFSGRGTDGRWTALPAHALPPERLDAISWLDEGRLLRVRRQLG